ncbi:MAG: quinol:cytochrome oxidoreductase, partial [Bacteroidetes bacterium]|nr:quinol:cytochrome oxidoreductase [Bacteroidota bacterium]
GYRETRLHTAGFLFGATGTTLALSFMTWVMTFNYPLNIGGKPYWPIWSFIPITFELTVLFASWGMVLTYCVRNKLIPGYVPRIYDVRTTDDRFALVFDIEGKPAAEVEKIKAICSSNGAVEVKNRVFKEGE